MTTSVKSRKATLGKVAHGKVRASLLRTQQRVVTDLQKKNRRFCDGHD
jgi:hypothetical protein